MIKNSEILGLTSLKDIDISKFYECFTLDNTIDFKEEFISINKIYLNSTSYKINKIHHIPHKKIVFINGDIIFRIEYKNKENDLLFKEFSFPFSKEINITNIICNIVNNNVNIFSDIFVNNIWAKKLTNNTLFIATFLTSTLEFI